MVPESEKIMKKIEELNWVDKYLKYVNLRKKGLKKESQQNLRYFFLDYNSQDKFQRRNFINLVHTIAFLTDEYNLFLPGNMNTELLEPDIKLWIKEDSLNPIPYKLSDSFEDNKKSLEIDPNDQMALEKFSSLIIGKISMNQHELEHGYPYDGLPIEDVAQINFFLERINLIDDLIKRNKILTILNELKQCALKYL